MFDSGLYINDTLEGRQQQSIGCKLQIISQHINIKNYIISLKNNNPRLNELLNMCPLLETHCVIPPVFKPQLSSASVLLNHPIFQNLSIETIYEILNLIYLQKYEDTLFYRFGFDVKILELGTNNFFHERLTIDQIEDLLSDPIINIVEFNNMFPGNVSSKAREKTLIFRYSNWKINHCKIETEQIINAIVLNDIFEINTNNYHVSKTYFIDNLYIAREKREQSLDFDNAYNILHTSYNVNIPKNYFFNATPGILKSIIQKTIRTHPLNGILNIDNNIIECKDVLLLAFTTLLFHVKKYFLPNLQRYCSGIESACKRLAVSIVEDSHINDYNKIVELLQISYIEQSGTQVSLDVDDFITFCNLALEAQYSKQYYIYDCHSYKQIDSTINIINNDIKLATYLLKQLGSFETDINMFNDIDLNRIEKNEYINLNIHILPIYHSLDHHCCPEIAYLLDQSINIINDFSFSNLFSWIWNNSSCYNPRKTDLCNIEFPEILRHAQQKLWKLIFNYPLINNNNLILEQFEYKLSKKDICAMVQMEYKYKQKTYIIVLLYDSDDDHYNPIIYAKPTRLSNMEIITNEIKEIITDKIEQMMMTSGIKLQSSFNIYSNLNNRVLQLIDGEYYIDNELIDNALTFQTDIYINNNIVLPNINDSRVINRLNMFVANKKDKIELFKINMHGDSVYRQAIKEDILVAKWLQTCCDKYPNVIKMITPEIYQIKNWFYIERLIREINHNNNLINNINNNNDMIVMIYMRDDIRALKNYQLEFVEKMEYRLLNNITKHAIWLETGMGKTKLVLEYIKRNIIVLKSVIIWTLPKSAIQSVVNEMLYYVDLVNINIVNNKNKILKKDKINLIEHDTLRILNIPTYDYMFICDEFHKCLDDTLRTSAALEFATKAKHMICMSGTMIKDTEFDNLIAWLSMCCHFAVSDKNYWCAFSETLIGTVKTNINVVREIINVNILNLQQYLSIIPPSLGGTNQKLFLIPALKLLYQSIIPVMIEKIIEILNNPNHNGIFVVCENFNMCNQIYNLLINRIDKKIIFLLGDQFPYLDANDTSPIKIVIGPIKKAEGYTLSKLDVMITSVYMTNLATRHQIEGRINRVSQIKNEIKIITILAGFLNNIYDKYEDSRNFMECIRSCADNIVL